MKIVIFTAFKPVLSQTWLLNELDVISKENVDFLIPYLSITKDAVRQSAYKKYSNNFIFLPRCKKSISKIISWIIFWHSRVFLTYPLQYVKTLLFILTQRNWVLIKHYFRLMRIISKIGNFHPDVFYSHYASDAYALAYLASRFFSKRFGLIPHSTHPSLFNIRFLNRKADFIIEKTDHMKKLILQKYPLTDSNKIIVLPWGIDTKYFRNFRKREHTHVKKIFKILFVSRFVEMKGIRFLLQACCLLVKQNISFRCILVGYGPEKMKMKEYIQRNSLSRFIKIKEAIPHSCKLRDLYSLADMFVLPSIVDGAGEFDVIPNAALEAMAMELPVVTTEVGGMAEVIQDGINGFFVKEKNEIDLANKIKSVMNLSDYERRRIGIKARKTIVKYYNKEKQGKKFVQFLRSQIY